MKLDEIYYFSIKKIQHPELYEYVQGVVLKAKGQNRLEVERRMQLLNRSTGNEHIRQVSNFIAEIDAFNRLLQQGLQPNWVPERENKMPDFEVDGVPVEVKHLNSPRQEHDALANGEVYGGDVRTDYGMGLEKKIGDFVAGSRDKFVSFNHLVHGGPVSKGVLYLYFSKSVNASILDGIEWEVKMHDRVFSIAHEKLKSSDEINLVVQDIDTIL